MIKNIKRSVILLIIIMISMFQAALGASWDVSAYKWADANKLTAYSNIQHLDKTVDNIKYYEILYKFLTLHNVEGTQQIRKYTFNDKNKKSLFTEIDSIIYDYLKDTTLTIKDYRACESLLDHTSQLAQDYPTNLKTIDKNNVDSYVSFLRYIINQKLEDKQLQKNMTKPEGFSLFEDYGYYPAIQDVSREEFLVMYYYITKNTTDSNDAIIKYYKDSNVIQGYNKNLMLDSNLTYAQLYQFLMRLNNLEKGNLNE